MSPVSKENALATNILLGSSSDFLLQSPPSLLSIGDTTKVMLFVPMKQTKANSTAMITAAPSTTLAIQNMISAFTTCFTLETQWRIQSNVFAIKLPGIPRLSMPKLPLPQIKGNKGQQSKDAGAIYVDDNPNSNLFTKPKAGTKTNTPASSSTKSSQVRVRAAGSPVKLPEAPSLDELRQRRGMEPNMAGNDGWKRFPSKRRPGKDMDMFLNMSKDMKRGSF